jgi:hypothetical protein
MMSFPRLEELVVKSSKVPKAHWAFDTVIPKMLKRTEAR